MVQAPSVVLRGAVALRFGYIALPGVLVITGPQEGPAEGRGHLRAAHADREQVVELLKTAYVTGRLTKDELDTRAGQALAARTYADLAALTADLPADPPADTLPRTAGRRNGPARTPGARNAAIASAGSVVGAFLLFWSAVRLDDSMTMLLLVAGLVPFLVSVILAAGAVVELQRARRRLPPGPGQPPAGRLPAGTAPAPAPPVHRTDQARTDARSHRPGQARQRGRFRVLAPVAGFGAQ